jgi:hypothetical protein
MSRRLPTTYSFLVGLAFVGFSIAAVIGLAAMVRSGAVTLAATAREIAYQQARADERFEISRVVEETAAERSELANYVLTEAKVIDFISEFERIAAARGLQFSTLMINPEKTKDPNFDFITMEVSFSGTSDAVMGMTALMETIPYQSEVVSLKMANAEGVSWTANLTLKLTVREYEK